MLGGLLGSVSSAFSAIKPFQSLIGAGLSFLGGHQQNAASAAAAQKQMDFQKEMANTSYQRQVADLMAAGINPMLVTKLGGAATPPGAMPSFVNPGAAAAQSFSAMQSSEAAKQQAETSERLSEPQKEQVEAATKKIIEEIKNIPFEGARIQEATLMLFNQARLYNQQALTQSQVRDQLTAIANKLVQETELIKGSVEAMRALDNLGKDAEALKPIIDIIKTAIGVFKK